VTVFDPRVTPLREDLAAAELEGVIASARYVDRRPFTVIAPRVPLAVEPGGRQQDALLFGEGFDVLEARGSLAWGQALRDGYVGWAPLDGLREGAAEPTHRVIALSAPALASPSADSDAWGVLGLNALVTVVHVAGGFLQAAGAGWIAGERLAPIGSAFERDPVAVAEQFVGSPYLWGGRDADGIDCSGLVQQALYACGRGCPRDSDQQEAALGRSMTEAENPRRGDLAFWNGHVGWVVDAATVLHAASFHRRVAVEALSELVGRAGPARFRRL